MAEPAHRSRPSRQGLTEYLLLVGALAILAAGAVALFAPEIRAALGSPPAVPAAPAPAAPSAPAADAG
ncbi:hypothetical protein [Anaeromyxobacter sp. PSR-1]|uniref:hypothetical protein n=1 Tax=unclassified Anaeromyxobacter TaxID=2620896 RepID=UPI0005DB681D|nr:hypothetical protein [Anaeromyxobacter sp. PSR-1]GAO02528.1 hypothetical protein PSR1_01400 [Anaeromyxobacter sp. PSR-1]